MEAQRERTVVLPYILSHNDADRMPMDKRDLCKSLVGKAAAYIHPLPAFSLS